MNVPFTIVISTYNRKDLLERCIDSIVKQNYFSYEIIVIDDCSDKSSEHFICAKYPSVNYIYLDKNGGPCKARNIGISFAKNEWIIIMDDDDTMKEFSLLTISNAMSSIEYSNYPVLNFARTNGYLDMDYKVVRIQDYINRKVKGEFVPVIQKELFLKKGYGYPDIAIGGESILWMDIAKKEGIPTWLNSVCTLHTDAGNRLTDTKHQIKKANEYAKFQEKIIERYKDDYLRHNKKELYKRYKGAILYNLLSKNKSEAFNKLKSLIKLNPRFLYLILFIYFPSKSYAQILLLLRKVQRIKPIFTQS
ncbi:glycosyltransferase family 2 protein [Priestia megaterium]|uniref:glycosyltransferase family 2 protein n=1 Tax=Priestia megaterium TaxID=1404 RepID=UPI002877490C|nr:glycosyltransferase family 2 protein [Priestia megaterium]MBX4160212.1 glycosyltransferase family 2 protein [Priestia megaterium]